MRTKNKILWGVLALVVLIGLWLRWDSKNPKYHDLRLSEWVEIAGNRSLRQTDSARLAKEALIQNRNESIHLIIEKLKPDSRFVFKFKNAVASHSIVKINPEAETLRWRSAMDALELLGKDARPAIPELLNWLEDPDANLRLTASLALSAIGEEPELVVPELIKALGDPHMSVQVNAAIALREFGEEARVAIPHLLKLTENSDDFVMFSAAVSVFEIGPETSEKTVPILAERLKNGRDQGGVWQVEILLSLAKMGPRAKSALPQIEAFCDSEDAHLKKMAEGAVTLISGEELEGEQSPPSDR